jgi:molybdate transport system substrate-binding protein
MTVPQPRRRPARGLAVLLCLLLLLLGTFAACGSDDDEASGSAGDEQKPVVVSAAASLKTALTAYGERFDGGPVRLSFAGSDELAAQIRQGIEPDVFAAANTKLPDQLFQEGLVEQPVSFASNELVLAVPSGGDRVSSLDDLARDGVTIAIGAEGVPVGDYTRTVIGRLPERRSAAILENVRSNEPDVGGVVGKLTQGAVDAGFVYRSDVEGTDGRLEAIVLPERLRPAVEYGVAVVKGAPNPAGARAFIDGLLDGAGARALEEAGFGPPAGRDAGPLVPAPAGHGAGGRPVLPDGAGHRDLRGHGPGRAAGRPRRSRGGGRPDAEPVDERPGRRLIVVVGTPAAYLLATRSFRGRSVVVTLIELPLVLPPAVAGIGLLAALGPNGLFGQALDDAGIRVVLTTASVVLALTFVAAPFYLRQAEAAFAALDRSWLDASRTLGAGEATTVRPRGDPRGAAGADRRPGPRVGARARGVRRHAHVRRLVPRGDADRAPGHLRAVRDRLHRRARLSAVLVAVSAAILLTVKLAVRASPARVLAR